MSETDKTAAWNTCPKCGELVDVDECTDGSEVRCSACNKRLVCTEYTDDSWGLTQADEGDNDDSDDGPDSESDEDHSLVDLGYCIGTECLRMHGVRVATWRGIGPCSIYVVCDECLAERLTAEERKYMVEVRGAAWVRHLGIHELHNGRPRDPALAVRGDRTAALVKAIRAITVEMPDDRPNGEAEMQLIRMEDILERLSRKTAGDERVNRHVRDACDAMAKLCTAWADDTRALRIGAEAYFGGDFEVPDAPGESL